jgi:hypothetical protein
VNKIPRKINLGLDPILFIKVAKSQNLAVPLQAPQGNVLAMGRALELFSFRKYIRKRGLFLAQVVFVVEPIFISKNSTPNKKIVFALRVFC